ncbi:hypothetical protein ACSBR2_031514 [Camellia fascicularis]
MARKRGIIRIYLFRNEAGKKLFCHLLSPPNLRYRMMKLINESCEVSKCGLSDCSQKLSANVTLTCVGKEVSWTATCSSPLEASGE